MLKPTDTLVPSRDSDVRWSFQVTDRRTTLATFASLEEATADATARRVHPDNLSYKDGETYSDIDFTVATVAHAYTQDGDGLGRCYAIPSGNLDGLVKKLKRLANKADKLGVAAPTWAQVGIAERERKDVDQSGIKRLWTQRLTVLAVDSTTVGVDGWDFVATLEGFKGEDGDYRNILRINPSVEDAAIPAEYRDRGPVCDHCNTNRRRNQTFLVRHAEDGGFAQVGRNCLADFLGGKDSADAARLASYERDLAVALADGEEGDGYGSVSMSTSILAFLSTVATHVRNSGWVSRGAARIDGGQATADEVLLRLHPVGAKEEQAAEALAAECPIEERDTAEAEATLDWVRGLEVDTDIGDNDYLWNLYVACSLGTVQPKEAGIVASAVSAHQRHLGKLRQRERTQSLAETSRHIGNPGDKIGTKLTPTDKRKGARLISPIPVTVHRIGGFEGHYGYTYIIALVTDDGSVLKWFASRNRDSSGESLTEGEAYVLSGSIKGHGDYKGVAETSVTRAALTPAAAAK
tara:strand:+ start:1305 stop:2870 length:1566 start_codon:yes stop_codon:yes gene_type:complete